MKKTLIALMALASVAVADTVVYTPLDNAENWTLGSARGRADRLTIDTTTQTIYSTTGNWAQEYGITSSFEAPMSVSLDTDSLLFSVNLTTNGTHNSCGTLALIDSTANKAIIVGMGKYNAGAGIVQYALGSVRGDNFYSMENLVEGDPVGTLGTIGTSGTMALSGSITMNSEGKAVATFGENTLELGTSFTVDKVVVSIDGANNGQTASLSNLTLTYTPEPATATLSLLALAGLAARRRRH